MGSGYLGGKFQPFKLGDRFVAVCLSFPVTANYIGGGFRHAADIAVAVEVAGERAD